MSMTLEDILKIYDELKFRNIIAQTTNEKKVEHLINSGEAIFYVGCDPTADSLHVGHFIQLMLISRLQKNGNSPICLFGGGTGCIGDPSGKDSMRRIMSKEEIEHNVSCFQRQMSRFFDVSKVKFVNNADWLCKLNYIDFLRDIGIHFNVNKMLAAECYKQRLSEGLTFMELNYMIMQGYDFLYLHEKYGCNLQIGGNDQWSNIIAGVNLIRKKTQDEVFGLTTNILAKSDGVKMGKTEGGAIWLDPKKTSPYDFYQYWRNVQDADVINCVKMLTNVDIETIEKIEKLKGKNLNNAKEILAYELTKSVHGEEEANKAKNASENLFKSGNFSSDIPCKVLNSEGFPNEIGIVELLFSSEIVVSKSEARRLVEQNGISVNGNLANLNSIVKKSEIQNGILIKKGKKTYTKIKF